MKKELFDKNPLLKLSFDFSLSATSNGANAMEAQNAESNADFIYKLKIAAKEAWETQYWLWLCEHSNNYPLCTHLIKQGRRNKQGFQFNTNYSKKNAAT